MVRVWVAAREPSLALGLAMLGRTWEVHGTAQLPEAGHLDAEVLVVDATRAAVAASTLVGPSLLVLGNADPGLRLGPGGAVIPGPATIEDVADGIELVVHDRLSDDAARHWAQLIDLDDLDLDLGGDTGDEPQQLELDLGDVGVVRDRMWRHRDAAEGDRIIDLDAPAPATGDVAERDVGQVIGILDVRVDPEDRDFTHRLGRTLYAATELEALIHEYPSLRDRYAIADAVVEEAAQVLELDTAAIWEWQDPAWHVLASRGYTRNQQIAQVSGKQPVFREVYATGGGVLIERTAQLVSAVSSIGGARTTSLAAAAMAAGKQRYGIIVAGRNRPLGPHNLEELIRLAREAAPAMATARLLERLAKELG